MDRVSYRQPPLGKVYLGHAIETALLGVLLPSSEHLTALHRLMLPIVELIPNALRITSRAPDQIFAQTFIGLSLLIAFLILVYFIVAMRVYHTKTFESGRKRFYSLVYGWIVFGGIMLGIAWFVPYLDPASKDRTYFLVMAATSGTTGVLTVMNQLIVGLPLFCLLMLWLGNACTNVRSPKNFI